MPVANNAWSGWAVEGGTLEVRGRWGDWDDRHSNVLTSVHLAREEGGPNLDEGGREWQRREINLRFVLINLPKLALFRGEEGGPDKQTQAGALPGFLGKVATPGVREHREGEEWKRKNPGETWQGSIAAPFVCLLSFCAKEIKNTPSAGAQLQC